MRAYNSLLSVPNNASGDDATRRLVVNAAYVPYVGGVYNNSVNWWQGAAGICGGRAAGAVAYVPEKLS
jgi:hypothetical protein